MQNNEGATQEEIELIIKAGPDKAFEELEKFLMKKQKQKQREQEQTHSDN